MIDKFSISLDGESMGTIIQRTHSLSPSALHRCAFGLLGASVRDKKHRILALEDEQSLSMDPEQCAKARQDLTNPRSRLTCELEWLPGVSPLRATNFCDLTKNDLEKFFKLASTERGLVRANLVAAGLELLSENNSNHFWTEQICALLKATDEIDAGLLMSVINEDRQLADFPLIQSIESVESELAARLRNYKNAIRDSLDRLGTNQMLKIVHDVVDFATASGESRGPALLDDLIDVYSLNAQSFLEKEAENLGKLVDAAKSVGSQTSTLKALLDDLEKVVANWTEVAKPIQLSMKSRGLEHDLSGRVGYQIRGLVIKLANESDDIESAQRVTQMLGRYFSQFPELAERVSDDLVALEDIAQRKLTDKLLVPIRELCIEATKSADSYPLQADVQGKKIVASAPGLLKIAEENGVSHEGIQVVKDEVAQAICSCAIDFGNQTSKWHACLALLESASNFATGADAVERVQKNLEFVRRNVRLYGNLEPITTAPSLYTLNGCGVALYGNSDRDTETGSYMATYYFVLLFVPIFPICRYRVKPTGEGGYRFLGKGKLRTFDKWHLAISIVVILIMFLQD